MHVTLMLHKLLHYDDGEVNRNTLGCRRPILVDVLSTSTWSLSFTGGSSNMNVKTSSHLGSRFFFTCCMNIKNNQSHSIGLLALAPEQVGNFSYLNEAEVNRY